MRKPERNLIGFCGVGLWRDGLEPEIGWWLARPYWGYGLATESGQVGLRDALRAGAAGSASSRLRLPGNKASTRIMENSELALECEFESDGIRLVRYAMNRAQIRYGSSVAPPASLLRLEIPVCCQIEPPESVGMIGRAHDRHQLARVQPVQFTPPTIVDHDVSRAGVVVSVHGAVALGALYAPAAALGDRADAESPRHPPDALAGPAI